MPVTVGLQNAGSFQVAGWPYLNTTILGSSEKEFKFNFISQEVTVWNSGTEGLEFYFVSGSSNVFALPAGKKVTMRIKTGSVYAKSASGTTIKLFVSMTNIPVGLIGTIPIGPSAGPMPDDDGDGIWVWVDPTGVTWTEYADGLWYPDNGADPIGFYTRLPGWDDNCDEGPPGETTTTSTTTTSTTSSTSTI